MAHVNTLLLLLRLRPLALLVVILLTQGEGVNAHENTKVLQTKTEKKQILEDKQTYEKAKETLREIFSKAKPVKDDYFNGNEVKKYNNDNEMHPENYVPTSRKRGIEMDLVYMENNGIENDQVDSLRSSRIQKDYTSRDNRVGPAYDVNHGHPGHEHTTQYLNEWAVHVEGGPGIAQSLATDLGYTYKGKIGGLEDVYLLLKADHPAVHRRAAPHLTQHLHAQQPVVWAEQQFAKARSKRGLTHQEKGRYDTDVLLDSVKLESDPQVHAEDIIQHSDNSRDERSIRLVDQGRQRPDQVLERVKKNFMDYVEELEEMAQEADMVNDNKDSLYKVDGRSNSPIKDQYKDKEKEANIGGDDSKEEREKRSEMASIAKKLEEMFNDESWYNQWYLFDSRTRPDLPELDLHVVPVWQEGITGKGIRISVLDDGLEWNHTDIMPNYDSEISYDVNSDDPDPMPHYDTFYTNSHGTRCAGEIAMAANNRKCGVGVAYGASIGGVRMLDGSISDRVEATSLSYAYDKVDVVSCSWGPTDDGTRVEGPGKLARMALKKGVTKGRDGKGIVYVWAAGNGGSALDNCNCDGYTSSIYTLSIGSASETGLFPWYGERCASTLATAYSSGAYSDQKIATTDLGDTCTLKFSGTSAAAPLAAGIVALALETNPSLTWRDLQHAVVWTSDWDVLAHNGGWQTNGRGLKFNPRFGFGLLNAEALVAAVKNWTTVSDKSMCRVEETKRSTSSLESGGSIVIELKSDGCADHDEEVSSLEHVEVIFTANYTNRGALTINLTSPMGTTTEILTERPRDNSTEGFSSWTFMSVHTWGEEPQGTWLLTIQDKTKGSERGSVGEVYMRLHGTREVPEHMNINRTYSERVMRQARVTVTEEDKKQLSSENLKSLTWEQLKTKVLQGSSISSLSDLTLADLDLLMETGQLSNAIQNFTPEQGNNNQVDLNLIQNMVQDFKKKK